MAPVIMFSVCEIQDNVKLCCRILTPREASQRIKSSPWSCYTYKKIPVYLIMLPFWCFLCQVIDFQSVVQGPPRALEGVAGGPKQSEILFTFSKFHTFERMCNNCSSGCPFFCLLILTSGVSHVLRRLGVCRFPFN